MTTYTVTGMQSCWSAAVFNWTNRLLTSLVTHVSFRQQVNQMVMFHRKCKCVRLPCNNHDTISQTIVCMSFWRMKKQRLLCHFAITINFMKDFPWDKNFERRPSRHPLSQSLHMRETTQFQHQLTVPQCYCITHLRNKRFPEDCAGQYRRTVCTKYWCYAT